MVRYPYTGGVRMDKMDRLAFLVGVVIAGLLTWIAYHSHSGPTRARDLVYLLLFPPSVGYMATDNATRIDRVFIVIFALTSNGLLYWLALRLLRKLIRHR